MSPRSVDILMITYNRPEYTRLALGGLLETCDADMRVWVWHNGPDADTLRVVESFRGHPRLHRVHHSPENKRLREPTNWLFREADGEFLSKVDDDCVVPIGWADTFRGMMADDPRLGVVSCWHFQESDYDEALARRKIVTLRGGRRLLRNPWVGGSGYLMRRALREQCGLIGEEETFTSYCLRASLAGWLVGWALPLVVQEHMDDPRAPHTLIKTDEDLRARLPLSAQRNGVDTVAEWDAQLRRSARLVLTTPSDPRRHIGWRRSVRNAAHRVGRLLGKKSEW